MNKTPRRRVSSTPNHSPVPSVATAAVEERMAGTTSATSGTMLRAVALLTPERERSYVRLHHLQQKGVPDKGKENKPSTRISADIWDVFSATDSAGDMFWQARVTDSAPQRGVFIQHTCHGSRGEGRGRGAKSKKGKDSLHHGQLV